MTDYSYLNLNNVCSFSLFRFPGQENGDFKIPSILWYTQDGQVRAAGAEARDTAMRLVAEDEDLIFVEWYEWTGHSLH